ncbi:MAG: FtsX-like permease family protein [Flavobacteriales bacterium]
MATLMMSIKEGVYTNMTDSMVASYTGFVQIHAKGFWEEKTLDESFEFTDEVREAIESNRHVSGYVQRIESFALSATEHTTKGAMVVGTDPEAEKELTKMHDRVAEGEYLQPGDRAVMIGSGLAEYHDVTVGDTIVLLGMGYHGANAAGKYPIKGIVKFGSPDLSKQLVIMPIELAKQLYGMENNIVNVVLLLDDASKAVSVAKDIQSKIGEQYEVMPWPELVPDLVDMIEADRAEGIVFMFILYMVISFGIFGTVLMMMAERRHEFGVLVAVGMKRVKLAFVVMLEVITIALFGAISGIFGAIPVISYFYFNPIRFDSGSEMAKTYEEYGMEAIIQSSLDPSIFIQQASIVALVAMAISIYPFISVLRISAIKAMRS